MALLKSPHDIEGEKQKKMEKLKKQMAYSDAVKLSVRIPKKIYFDLKVKMLKDRRLNFQGIMIDLLTNYLNKE